MPPVISVILGSVFSLFLVFHFFRQAEFLGSVFLEVYKKKPVVVVLYTSFEKKCLASPAEKKEARGVVLNSICGIKSSHSSPHSRHIYLAAFSRKFQRNIYECVEALRTFNLGELHHVARFLRGFDMQKSCRSMLVSPCIDLFFRSTHF